jgi:hypothetical protein
MKLKELRQLAGMSEILGLCRIQQITPDVPPIHQESSPDLESSPDTTSSPDTHSWPQTASIPLDEAAGEVTGPWIARRVRHGGDPGGCWTHFLARFEVAVELDPGFLRRIPRQSLVQYPMYTKVFSSVLTVTRAPRIDRNPSPLYLRKGNRWAPGGLAVVSGTYIILYIP